MFTGKAVCCKVFLLTIWAPVQSLCVERCVVFSSIALDQVKLSFSEVESNPAYLSIYICMYVCLYKSYLFLTLPHALMTLATLA